MHVFYQPHIDDDEIVLSEEESKHCVRVLRLDKDDEVTITDGKGAKASAVLLEAHPKKCVLKVMHREQMPKLHNYDLNLLVAPTKNFDRMEWLIEKLVESGINRITFIQTTNGERTKVNMERCRKIAISAMKQSRQWWLPQIDDVVPFEQAVKEAWAASVKLVAWCPVAQQESISKQLQHAQQVALCIGPEGDFTSNEIAIASRYGFIPVSLGASILRTETAALYACMAVKNVNSQNL
jgi:16S rRNA (uracil1498-N3)-methyltransferase